MNDVVIRAEGLGKRYLIGHQVPTERYRTLRDAIGATLGNFTRSARDMAAGRQLVAGDATEEFWALKDVSFEIKRGEIVGIIGRNGAGKSTLLKILSRITEPSEGRVEIKGRVASLLEVGTGFHPELTGRENIYLNGAILGMTRAEINRKFDEIVAFAEIEKFLDTPVKRYSSGMYVRLAFAVAAHLEPEILVVDEVLAVGDIEFQKKCLGKMGEVAGHGRTVLFVSHNISSIKTLCSSAIYIQNGLIQTIGPVGEVCDLYLARSSAPEAKADLSNLSYSTSHIRLHSAFVHDASGVVRSTFVVSEDVFLGVDYTLTDHAVEPVINLHVFHGPNIEAFTSINYLRAPKREARLCAKMRIPAHFLNYGTYYVSLFASSFNPDVVHAQFDGILSFNVLDEPHAPTRVGYQGPFPGPVRPIMEWSLDEPHPR